MNLPAELESSSKTRVWVAGLQIVTGIAFIVYWILFFTTKGIIVYPPPCYYEFEYSFPLPNAILTIALLGSGYLTLKNVALAFPLSLVAAGPLIYLAFLAFSFNTLNGIYQASALNMAIDIFVHVWCIAIGGIMIWYHGFYRRPSPNKLA